MLKEWHIIAISLLTVVAGIVTIWLMFAILGSIKDIDTVERTPVDTSVISTPEAPQQTMTVESQEELLNLEIR